MSGQTSHERTNTTTFCHLRTRTSTAQPTPSPAHLKKKSASTKKGSSRTPKNGHNNILPPKPPPPNNTPHTPPPLPLQKPNSNPNLRSRFTAFTTRLHGYAERADTTTTTTTTTAITRTTIIPGTITTRPSPTYATELHREYVFVWDVAGGPAIVRCRA